MSNRDGRTPRFWPGFRLSIDYTKIDKTDWITSLTAQQIFDVEDRLPGRITRAPLAPADQAMGYKGGTVAAFNSSSVKFARHLLEAVDFPPARPRSANSTSIL